MPATQPGGLGEPDVAARLAGCVPALWLRRPGEDQDATRPADAAPGFSVELFVCDALDTGDLGREVPAEQLASPLPGRLAEAVPVAGPAVGERAESYLFTELAPGSSSSA